MFYRPTKTIYSGLIFFIFATLNLAYAQAPHVPQTIRFADMTLHLNNQAQRDIQLDVDALHRNPSYFKTKMERVDLYMPVIEQVLREQGVPDDLKYLVIQESGLIPDAVSTSNAVGFWQFKKGTAHEVFLQVDNQIDERKNIVASTKGAAIYLKKNNSRFDNWVCAMVAYQMGLGGAQNYFGSQYNGDKTMKITRNTHWYFKKYLAHKIAFESQMGKFVSNQHLEVVEVQGPATLSQLAKNLKVSESHLEAYNKWVSRKKIPGGKTYSLTYLATGAPSYKPVLTSSSTTSAPTSVPNASHINQAGYPKITGKQSQPFERNQIRVNGIKGIVAAVNTTPEDFAERIGIRDGKFRRVNDLSKSDPVLKGQYYYTKRKKGKAKTPYHVVRTGETLWGISQAYGIRLHSLKAKNRLYKDEDLREGMILKLQKYRRRNEPFEYRQIAPSPPKRQSGTPKPSPTSTKTAAPSPTSQAPRTQLTHKVAKGETLYAIARKYGVTVSQIQQWNQIGNQSVIQVGQELIIRRD
ncbi:LysM peptidoglycan-binding domain-containing protein [Echinicola soli]|uniref:LysM peptidoglycan-binding domain-containing protein n=1 Tax=Echinicola soli TaxID=2591634 RepID=A0A514CCN0_9BACT|nr:lytic transglycosylase domain-containing protein [Echinicola soli]QDH77558.1 LysM peptidoglycan-binding domain-containing protein [Echinicola soli]